MDFTVIKRAGLTQPEFAALAQVSRVTVNSWVNGKMNPHRYTKDKVKRLLDRVEQAVASGALPLDSAVPKSGREEALDKAVYSKEYEALAAVAA